MEMPPGLEEELEGLMHLVGYEWGSDPDDYVSCVQRAKALLESQGRDSQKRESQELMRAIVKVAEASEVSSDFQPHPQIPPHPLSALRTLYVRIKRKTDPAFRLPLNESLASRFSRKGKPQLPQSNFEDIYNMSNKIIR